MAYVKNIWVDQDVERPKTYEVTNNQDGSITLTDSFGLVTELGTPVNAVNMNHIEGGIESNDIRIGDLDDLITTAKDNLVDAVNEIAGSGDKADTDLSNLTATGENHFTNKNLSNLTATGKTKVVNLAHELDFANAITVSSTSSNSTQTYTPTADGMFFVISYIEGGSSTKTCSTYIVKNKLLSSNHMYGNTMSGTGNAYMTSINWYAKSGEQITYYMYTYGSATYKECQATFVPFKKS
jgi:hypothetical protein